MNMRILLIASLVFAIPLTGCVNTKLVPEYIFPTPPAELMVAPQPLKTLPVKKITQGASNDDGTHKSG